jgi:hypothetical protein
VDEVPRSLVIDPVVERGPSGYNRKSTLTFDVQQGGHSVRYEIRTL